MLSHKPKTTISNPVILFKSAIKFLRGDQETKEDIPRGIALLHQAAAQKYSDAQYVLSEAYLLGTYGLPINLAKAEEFLEAASQQQHPLAQNDLGEAYCDGTFHKIDRKKGLSLFKKAAAQHYSKAQYNLGAWYHKGDDKLGIKRDLKKAINLLEASAKQDCEEAQKFLFEIYSSEKPDPTKAFYWGKCIADKGDPDGQLYVAEAYYHGTITKEDHQAALTYYVKAISQHESTMINQHYCGAYFNTAFILYHGLTGKKEVNKAKEYFRKALALTDDENWKAIIEFKLGMIFSSENEEEALRLFKLSANKKYPLAILWLKNKIFYDPKIINMVNKDEKCFLPIIPPKIVDQVESYCGSAALAGAANYAQSKTLFASQYELKFSGRTEGTVVLDKLKETEYASDGPQFSIHSFTRLAQRLEIKGKAVLKTTYTLQEYKQTLFAEFNNNNVLILSCDSINYMPTNTQGHNSHWVFSFGYKGDELAVTHNGVYCWWPIDNLWESNKQLPEKNPLAHEDACKGIQGSETLLKFRFSFFSIPFKGEREVLLNGVKTAMPTTKTAKGLS